VLTVDLRLAFPIALASVSAAAQTGGVKPPPITRSVPDPGVITTGQTITPAGVQTIVQGTVWGIATSGNPGELWILSGRTTLQRVSWTDNQLLQRIELKTDIGGQGIQFDPETGRLFLAMSRPGQPSARPTVFIAEVESDSVRLVADSVNFLAGSDGNKIMSTFTPGGARGLPGVLAFGGKPGSGRIAVLPLYSTHQVAIIDLDSGRVRHLVHMGVAPFGAVVDSNGRTAFVTNMGGRDPRPGEPTSRLGDGIFNGDPNTATAVAVDANGQALPGTVSRIDLATGRVTATITVGRHPLALAWDEQRGRLYVANVNDDGVSVIDTRTNKLVKTISLQPFVKKVVGVRPSALALTRDGSRLYVTCMGLNAVAVVDLTRGTLSGLIPTAWYPTTLVLSSDEKHLAIGTHYGVGSGEANFDWVPEGQRTARHVHNNRGAVNVVDVPDAEELQRYTLAVSENDRLPLGKAIAIAVTTPDRDSSSKGDAPPLGATREAWPPINHIVYIIKENRTFDEALGDIPGANGDTSLVMYGMDVTPNHHALAQRYGTFDNFYASGASSNNGHQWVHQANETLYGLWGGSAFDPYGGFSPMGVSSGGFLWDAVLAKKKTVLIFGELAGRSTTTTIDRTTGKLLSEKDYNAKRAQLMEEWEAGKDFSNHFRIVPKYKKRSRIIATNFPAYGGNIPDVVRAQIFAGHMREWERTGKMPNFIVVQLPSDHLGGTSPGYCTPRACFADNDYAMGMIVETVSRSRFWKNSAIFVVEDDAQGGVDHVDGHRTIGLFISPYGKRDCVDHTFYAQQSMVRTIEELLGLAPLSVYDLIATPMRGCTGTVADLTPYDAMKPQVPLTEVNPSLGSLQGKAREAAIASMQMDFTIPDAVPSDQLNRILWHTAKGWDRPYPERRTGAFFPHTYALKVNRDDDDDDRQTSLRRKARKQPKRVKGGGP
jgi:YVTN family beta-propeller protein